MNDDDRPGYDPEETTQDHPSDASLMREARADAAAFGQVYERRVGQVHAWLARRAPQDAADLTAETFAKAWLHRRRFRDERDGSALPWLLGIARNLLSESVRRDRIEIRARERLGLPVALDRHDGPLGYEGVVARLSPDPVLRAAVCELPEHERRALELRVIHELPYREVARTLAIRPAAARLRVSRALRRLSIALFNATEEA